MHGSKFPLGGSIKYSLAISIYLSIYLCNCNTTQEKSCMHIKKIYVKPTYVHYAVGYTFEGSLESILYMITKHHWMNVQKRSQSPFKDVL